MDIIRAGRQRQKGRRAANELERVRRARARLRTSEEQKRAEAAERAAAEQAKRDFLNRRPGSRPGGSGVTFVKPSTPKAPGDPETKDGAGAAEGDGVAGTAAAEGTPSGGKAAEASDGKEAKDDFDFLAAALGPDGPRSVSIPPPGQVVASPSGAGQPGASEARAGSRAGSPAGLPTVPLVPVSPAHQLSKEEQELETVRKGLFGHKSHAVRGPLWAVAHSVGTRSRSVVDMWPHDAVLARSLVSRPTEP